MFLLYKLEVYFNFIVNVIEKDIEKVLWLTILRYSSEDLEWAYDL